MNLKAFLSASAALLLATQPLYADAPDRRANRAPRRYQPNIASCTDCRPQHRNVLIFADGGPRTPTMQKCFSTSETEGSAGLRTVLSRTTGTETFILVRASILEPELLSVMVERLGNVSVVLLGRNASYSKVSKRCHSLGPACHQVDSLVPILEEVMTREKTRGRELLKSVFGVGRWTEGVEEELLPFQQQQEMLIRELCKTDKARNLLIEIRKESTNGLFEGDQEEDFKFGLSLKDILPLDSKSYDKNRPPKTGDKPTIVYFHVTVLSLDSINEESMTYVADIFLAQSWRDPRLRLPERMSQQYRILDVDWLHDIWRPDSFFKNAKQVTFHEITIPNHYVWLYNDKTLLYMSKLTLVLSCAMKFESYPHDIQICSMMIESLSHTAQDLVFLWNITDPLVVNPEIELPQLDIASNYTSDCTVQYSTGNFTCLAVVFTLRRRLGYHLLHTYIPSALIVVMSWISFWIKPEAIPARVTLGVTSLLTLATQNTQSQQSLPPVSYVKAIDIWMSSCSVFVFLSLMEFAVVNNYMGPSVRKGMMGCSEEELRAGGVGVEEERYRVQGCTGGRLEEAMCSGKEAALCIDRFSRYFFPFSFFVLNAVYWSVFL